MPDCSRIDPLVTPFVDGELPQDEQQTLTQHITVCSSCRGKVVAERAIRAVMQARRTDLSGPPAPAGLKARCAHLHSHPAPIVPVRSQPRVRRTTAWGSRLAPLSLAALLVVAVGGALLYVATRSSSRVLAAELAMDHEKCFRLNRILGTHQSPTAVEASMAWMFGWNVDLPDTAELDEVSLVGSRPCLYGEGKVAHIMYMHKGQPVSLFMLPRENRPSQLVKVFGHQAQMWSEGDRTFVLVSRESASDMEQMAALVRTTMR